MVSRRQIYAPCYGRSARARSGQATLILVAVAAALVAGFAMLASTSIDQRRREEVATLRQLYLRNLEVQLQQSLRSPHYVNKMLIASNPSLQEFLLQAAGEHAPIGTRRLAPGIVIPAVGGKDVWLGNHSGHAALDFGVCRTSPGTPCAFESVVTADALVANGVGYVQLKIRFAPRQASTKTMFNADAASNQIRASFSINLEGVELAGSRAYCAPGFKTLMVAQDPTEFLCIRE